LIESNLDEDNPRVLIQPYEPDDLDHSGQLKDKESNKYYDYNKNQNVIKSKGKTKKVVEKDPAEFSSSGGGSVAGYAPMALTVKKKK
jgi:hypothetical protein